MATHVRSSFEEALLVRLEPNEDIYEALMGVSRDLTVRAAVVLSITGACTNVKLQRFTEHGKGVEIVSIDEPVEVSGHGIVGRVHAPELGSEPFGAGHYVDGQPYIHVHLTVTTSTDTICGHLVPGCLVRSHNANSHFTIAMATISDVALDHVYDPANPKRGTSTAAYHDVYRISDRTMNSA